MSLSTIVYPVLIQEEGCDAYVHKVCKSDKHASEAAKLRLEALRSELLTNEEDDPDALNITQPRSDVAHWVLARHDVGVIATATVMSSTLE